MNDMTDQNLTRNLSLSEEELRWLQVKLLAAMTRADGRILEIEKLVSESLIGVMDKSEILHLQSLYEEELKSSSSRQDIGKVIKMLERTSEVQRNTLAKILSSIAMADGEFHKKEQDLLMAIMNKLEMDS